MRSQDTLDVVESLRTNETRRGCHSLVVYTCYHYSTGLIQQNGVVDATVIFWWGLSVCHRHFVPQDAHGAIYDLFQHTPVVQSIQIHFLIPNTNVSGFTNNPNYCLTNS